MASADLVAWRAAYVAAPESIGGEDALLALHREMNRMLDNAGIGFGFRFDVPEFRSLASVYPETRGGHLAINNFRHREAGR